MVISWIQTHLLAVWLVWTGVSLMFIPWLWIRRQVPDSSESTSVYHSRPSLFTAAGGMFLLWIVGGSVWMNWTSGLGEDSIWRSVLGALFIPFLPILWGFWVLRRRSLRVLCGLESKRILSGFMWSLAGILVAMPWVWWSLQGTLKLWEWLDYQHPQKHSLLLELDRSAGIGIRIAVILAAVVVAPVFEEMLFRGFLQTGFRRMTRSAVAAVGMSSLIFALIHAPWQAPPIFVLSLFLGWVYERTRSLWAPIGMHAAFNALVIVVNSLSR